jgi:hypothetical protein
MMGSKSSTLVLAGLVTSMLVASCGGEAAPSDVKKKQTDAGPTTPNRFPCHFPAPIDGNSGFERCSNGMIHRRQQGVCSAAVPRPEFVAPDDGVPKGCWRDSDCASMGAHAYCAHARSLPAGEGYFCMRGCADDSECRSDEICACGDGLVGLCEPSSCRSDKDCAAGYLCASYVGACSLGRQFGCQTERDTCSSDLDCESPTPKCVGGASLAFPPLRHCGNQTCVPFTSGP